MSIIARVGSRSCRPLAGTIVSIAYIARSIWLIAIGVVLLIG